ncbi:MAG: sigma-70 family RNA polymerase sigma factor [Candidatus Dormibacteraeota bacterium]|nr:sigma-70 family RNA polymerase sigma factor [Candidatus Dormibacteraeota bacterium]
MSLPPFQEFLDQHRDDVYRLLVAMVGRDDADDCFQETFLSALRAYPSLRAGSNLRAWVHTIARRKAVDTLRRRRPVAPLEDHQEHLAAHGDGEATADLWSAVRALPEKQRWAIAYRYAVGLTSGETAAITGGSDAAVRQNTRDALRKLRVVYAEGGPA